MPTRSPFAYLTYFRHLTPTHLSTRIHWSTMSAAPPPARPIKVLMLHGYTQSGPLFQAKTGALRKTLQKAFPAGCELVYPTAPIRLTPADESFLAGNGTSGDANNGGEDGKEKEEIDAWAWWRRKGEGEPYTYEGIELGLGHIAEVLKTQGPFDGVVGFSQGGACAAMLASLLEPGRREAFEAQYPNDGMRFPESFEADTGYVEGVIHAPLKFAVSYSGFAARGKNPYHAFYEPKIKTPVLHFLGTQDVVVEEARSLALVEACEHRDEKYVVYHPGGHFLPSTQKASVNALIGFIKEVLHGEDGDKKKEESVEDMDVPF
ncbi:serine hydrolase-domain-containing protein [Paraphoma chrysanthemicola]|uniref:Serine hydrolase-domain-containing protein n=1 Tax=Paraphoma chrysanthemicola TaxID=798071 RepID=A0A8K0R0U1_9PLEO|nr:serine hydrolase-domain-containing protein [Paraphoma chrysanthemicola]